MYDVVIKFQYALYFLVFLLLYYIFFFNFSDTLLLNRNSESYREWYFHESMRTNLTSFDVERLINAPFKTWIILLIHAHEGRSLLLLYGLQYIPSLNEELLTWLT